MDPAKTIAAGGQAAWQKTYEHPQHGELTFTAELPKNKDWLAHQITQEQIAPGLGGRSVLAAAIAAIGTLIEPPVVSEKREDDPDNPDHIKIRQVKYDPLEDEDMDFVTQVWLDFFNWRAKTLSTDTTEQVKNSSGATSGDATDGSSPGTTDSPQTTPE